MLLADIANWNCSGVKFMNRRSFMRVGLLTGAGVLTGGKAMAATEGRKGAFDIVEAGVADLQAAMQSGKVTSQQLVKAYVARIRAVDKAGPRINSIIELNPDAPAIAAALDKERKAKGPRGPLHGIPVLLKDNIATADIMQTTAGSLALLGIKPPRDAFLVAKLRDAGAVILGKTNLSEWANIRSTRSTSGWSARGGLTRNPYALDRNTSGSSSGSAAAVAASRNRDRWLDHLAVVDQRSGRHQADAGTHQPQRHHSHRALAGHGRADDTQRG
jgi:amidase